MRGRILQPPMITTESISTENSEFWHEAVCRTLPEGDCANIPAQGFHGELNKTCLSELSLVRVRSIGQHFNRTPHHITHSKHDLFAAMLQLSGSGLVIQDGREVLLNPGDLTFTDSARQFALHFGEDFEQLVVILPHELVERALGPTQRMTTRLCQANTPLGSIVSPFLRQVASVLDRINAKCAQRLSDIGLSLIMATLTELAAAPLNHPSWARMALRYRAQVFINTHARDHTLNPGIVACALHISTRYLQELFRDENTTPSEYIWRCRLEKCRSDLSDPMLAAMNVSEIALRGGFQDFAHFCHRFKEAYGISAREFRFAYRQV